MMLPFTLDTDHMTLDASGPPEDIGATTVLWDIRSSHIRKSYLAVTSASEAHT